MSEVYDFFIPIAARLWRSRTGYEPVVLLVGTREEWSAGHCGVVLKELEREGYPIEMVDHVDGVDDGNVSMSVRQHAAALQWMDFRDILMVGDIDLFPVRRDFYHQSDPNRITIYHAQMYNDAYWPAYGPTMSVATWREVMDLGVGDLAGSVRRTFEDGRIQELIAAKSHDYRDSRIWIFDEVYASKKIRESKFYGSVLRVNSDSSARLCRNSWPEGARAADYIDAHCPRPGWSEENWTKIRALLAQIMPEDLPQLDRYVDTYRKNLPSIRL